MRTTQEKFMGKPCIVNYHDSIVDWLDLCDLRPNTTSSYFYDKTFQGGHGKGAKWYGEGIKTCGQGLHQLKAGWPVGQKKLQEISDQFSIETPRIVKVKRRAVRGRMGDELDIHSVRAGNLDRAWRLTEKTKPKRAKLRRITIIGTFGGHCNRMSEELFYSAAAASVLTQKLNSADVAIELLMIQTCRYLYISGKDLFHGSDVIPVKHPNQAFNMGAVATMACPASLRVGLFMSRCHIKDKKVMGNHGFEQQIDEKFARQLVKRNNPVVFIPMVHTREGAMQLIKDNIERFNG